MAFSSVLSFLLSTHSIDCAVPLSLYVHRVNSALFLPSTALIVLVFFSPPRKLCPFQMAPCPYENMGRTLTNIAKS